MNRLKDKKGICQTGRKAVVSSFGPHFGEESVLVGEKGSGTIFFSGCNLKCCFCQNYQISHLGLGSEVDKEDLAKLMLKLKRMGCHNINLVSPTHVIPQITEALPIAIEAGLDIPIVYNSGGYDSVAALKILDGIIDIYMPDAKYGDNSVASELSDAKDYVEVNQKTLNDMHRQVGNLKTERGVAHRGVLIRHLVLPNGLAGSEKILKFIAEKISKDSYVNIMDQYRPCYLAYKNKNIARKINNQEFKQIVNFARQIGLHRGF